MDPAELQIMMRRLEGRLWPSDRRRLGRRLLDRRARELIPGALDQAGFHDEAGYFRDLPPLTDNDTAATLGAARAICPTNFDYPSIAQLKKSVPPGAFIVPHVPGWMVSFSGTFDLPKCLACLMAHILEEDIQSLPLLATYVTLLADACDRKEEMARILLEEADSLASKPS